MKNLLPKYAELITTTSEAAFAAGDLPSDLLMAQDGPLQTYYAPFDYVNTNARIVLVGITPGRTQAVNALVAARRDLLAGADLEAAARNAKEAASFSGSMRPNLVALLDHFRVNSWLGIASCASLFASDTRLVHYTSVLRYPTFKDGNNYSGTPSILNTPFLRRSAYEYFAEELGVLRDALIIPLGDQVAEAVLSLAKRGQIDEGRVLAGIPHPSGANNERIAYMLGRKSAGQCSTKTNPAKLDALAGQLSKKMTSLLEATR